MIFGFNIIRGIPDDLAVKIMEITGAKLGKYSYDTPANNAIRGICVNHATGCHYLRLIVNAGVLKIGKETLDIEFTKEPDFSVLDQNFYQNLIEIMGKDNAERLPPLREWILWIMVYGMDIQVTHADELIKIFEKTDIPINHLTPPSYKHIYDAGKSDRRLKIFPKSEMIKSCNIDYKEKINSITDENTLRLSLINKRSDMGCAKRFLTKFEMDLGHLSSFLNPLVVTNALLKSYQDSIGDGDFYKYENAVQIVEERIPNYKNRTELIELLTNINQKGTIAKARLISTDKLKFQKNLKLLREIGINGAPIDRNSKLNKIENPYNGINNKCNKFFNT